MKVNVEEQIPATLSVAQAAEVLGMTTAAVYSAIATGRLPARKWHGRVLLLASELSEYLQALPRPVTLKPVPKR